MSADKHKLVDEFRKLRKAMEETNDLGELKSMIIMERYHMRQIARNAPEDLQLYV